MKWTTLIILTLQCSSGSWCLYQWALTPRAHLTVVSQSKPLYSNITPFIMLFKAPHPLDLGHFETRRNHSAIIQVTFVGLSLKCASAMWGVLFCNVVSDGYMCCWLKLSQVFPTNSEPPEICNLLHPFVVYRSLTGKAKSIEDTNFYFQSQKQKNKRNTCQMILKLKLKCSCILKSV